MYRPKYKTLRMHILICPICNAELFSRFVGVGTYYRTIQEARTDMASEFSAHLLSAHNILQG